MFVIGFLIGLVAGYVLVRLIDNLPDEPSDD
jgi:uncharacterized membrane-anchored protein YhcB (DUF1043 family)